MDEGVERAELGQGARRVAVVKSVRYTYVDSIILKASIQDMIRVSSTEFDEQVERYRDAALSQPVTVTRDGHDRTVLISVEEYRRLKRRDRSVLTASDMPSDVVEAVRHSRMDPRHDHLDDLLADWTP